MHITNNIQQLFDFSKENSTSHKRWSAIFRSLLGGVLLYAAPLVASFERQAPEPRQHALAGSGIAFADAHCTLNPGAAPNPGYYFVSAAYACPYGLKELQENHLSFGRAFSRIAFSVGAQNFGYELYRESTYYMGLSYRLVEGIHLGALLRYAEVAIIHYGHADAWPVDIGGLIIVSPAINFGFAAKNIAGANIGRCREELPRSLQTGLAVQALPKLRIGSDLFKDIRFPATLRCGAEWQPQPFFSLRAGMETSPPKLGAGLSLQFKGCRFDYGVDLHELLGMSHQFALTLTWRP